MKVDIKPDYQKLFIRDPEFKYIFTIDLGGRIIDEEGLFDKVRENDIGPRILERRDGNYKIKRVYEKKESDIDFNESTDQVYHVVDMKESTVKYYVDSYLLHHTTPLRWLLNKGVANRLVNQAIIEFESKKVICSTTCTNPDRASCGEYKKT